MSDFSGPVAAATPRRPLSPASLARLDAHRSEFQKLSEALGQHRYPEERAILAGSLLGAAGYLLRRSKALAADGKGEPAVDAALKRLPREDVAAWLNRATLDGLKQSLLAAADAAFEVALSEQNEEREEMGEAAMGGLGEREKMEAMVVALRRWEELCGALDERPRQKRTAIENELKNIDKETRTTARALATINDSRRAERDLLDREHIDGSWWYALRSDCDDLVALLTGRSFDCHHCDACKRDSKASRQVEAPPPRHLSQDDLWNYDLGLLSREQRSWVNRHAAGCSSCKDALRALADGEAAIAEASEAPGKRAEVEPLSEVAFEHGRFRVLVMRAGRRSRLLLEEKSPGALLRVQLAGQGQKPRRIKGGFEVQISGRSEPVRASLRASLAGGEEVAFEVLVR